MATSRVCSSAIQLTYCKAMVMSLVALSASFSNKLYLQSEGRPFENHNKANRIIMQINLFLA